MTKKGFFKGLATMLLLPGGFILAALAAIVLAGVLAVLVYFVAFWAVCQELAKAWRQSNFRKAAQEIGRDNGRSRPELENVAGLPEDCSIAHKQEIWDGRQAAHRKWLQ
jgi:hypothetical protein